LFTGKKEEKINIAYCVPSPNPNPKPYFLTLPFNPFRPAAILVPSLCTLISPPLLRPATAPPCHILSSSLSQQFSKRCSFGGCENIMRNPENNLINEDNREK
jgi:hypothetical protein